LHVGIFLLGGYALLAGNKENQVSLIYFFNCIAVRVFNIRYSDYESIDVEMDNESDDNFLPNNDICWPIKLEEVGYFVFGPNPRIYG
jgi:hypothetical protein